MSEPTGRPATDKPSTGSSVPATPKGAAPRAASGKQASRSADPATRRGAQGRPEPRKQRVGNPTWWVPVMCGLMIAGVIWVSTFYISEGAYPVTVGYWNLAIGMGMIMLGFLMTTRWK